MSLASSAAEVFAWASSPARACSHTPSSAALAASRPCASSAPTMPVSTSPLPAVAMPGLPPRHTALSMPAAAINVPAPFSTAVTPPVANRVAASGRLACTEAVLWPNSRPASPGCGVTTAPSGRALTPGPSASTFRPSASTTSGLPASRHAASSSSAQVPRPSPGPTATALACASRSSMSAGLSAPRTISSGLRANTAGRLLPRVATCTKPAPARSAASPANSGAPPMSVSPPTTSRRPKSPLWAFGRRCSRASAVPFATAMPGQSSASSGSASGASSTSPVQSTAGPVTRPSLAATKVTVSSALTGLAVRQAPVSASIPLGTSKASTGRPASLMRSTAAAIGGRSGPLAPVPSSASTTTSPSGCQSSAAGAIGPNRSMAKRYAASASPRSRAGSATATTCTSKPASLASPATT